MQRTEKQLKVVYIKYVFTWFWWLQCRTGYRLREKFGTMARGRDVVPMIRARFIFSAGLGLALWLFSVAVSAESRTGTLVLGSFANPEFAEQARRDISSAAGIELDIVSVNVRGAEYYRVVTRPLAEREARALRDTLPVAYQNAWFSPNIESSVVHTTPSQPNVIVATEDERIVSLTTNRVSRVLDVPDPDGLRADLRQVRQPLDHRCDLHQNHPLQARFQSYPLLQPG